MTSITLRGPLLVLVAIVAVTLTWRVIVAGVDAMRERGEPTVPSTIADELATNPFLRVREMSVRERFPGDTPADVLGAVRKAKDGFKG